MTCTADLTDYSCTQAAGLFDAQFARIFGGATGIETKRTFTRTDDKGGDHVVVITRTCDSNGLAGLRSEVVK